MSLAFDEHLAKQELLRLEEHLDQPILLIGGLAVQQYHRSRVSRDLDLVCSLQQQKILEKRAYPSNTYEFEATQNDLRPNVTYRNLTTGTRIYIGSKISERKPYPYIVFEHYLEEARSFTYNDKVCHQIVVPAAHHLAFSKLISHIARRGGEKSTQDLEDFRDLSNNKAFSLNHFLAYICRVNAEQHISKYFSETDFSAVELNLLEDSSAFRVSEIFSGLRSVKHANQSDSKRGDKPTYSRAPRKQKRLPIKTPIRAKPEDKRHRLPLSKIYYGSIDVNFELDSASDEDLDLFYETYFTPPGLSISDFLSGKKYLVHGFKGTGKTCLLRFLEQKIIRDEYSDTEPELFRFRTDFPDLIYNDVRRAFHNNADFTSSERSRIYRDLSYEDVWIYTLLKQVSHRINIRHERIFEQNDQLEEFLNFSSSLSVKTEQRNIYRFLPGISNGTVNVKGSESISFGQYVRSLLSLFGKLTPIKGAQLYFLLDEIEPRTGSTFFELDCILIRDLVGAINRLNSTPRRGQKGVLFIAAVRSEVLDRAQLLGDHIVKVMEHYGVSVNWGDLGAINVSHPLVKMICNKIAASEKRFGQLSAEFGQSEEDIWPRYFRKNKREVLEPRYLLDKTWHRPRDIVRLLDACKSTDANADQITESLLSKSENRYSNLAWQFDISQHLLLSIDPFSIDGLVEGLTGIEQEISISEFEARLQRLKQTSTSVERLLTRYSHNSIINSLYDAGVFGTRSKATGTRFVFRGNTDPDMTGKLIIHPGLRKRFSTLKSGRRKS